MEEKSKESSWSSSVTEASITIIVMADFIPSVHAPYSLYLFGETASNEISPITLAVKGFWRGFFDKLLICGCEHKHPDYSESRWRNRLLAQDIPEGKIVSLSVPLDAKISSSASEAAAVVEWAKSAGVERMIFTAQPLHLVRCACLVISQIIKQSSTLIPFFIPGTALPWNENIIHSQGAVEGRRDELINGEFARADKQYGNRFDALKNSEVLKFLVERHNHIAASKTTAALVL